MHRLASLADPQWARAQNRQASPPATTGTRLTGHVETMEPGLELLHQIFERQAEARPGAIAVHCGSQCVTYADLEGRANRLAHRLLHLGVAPGTLVAVLLPRSIDVYAALLGIMKAGAAYVPIDPECPPDRVTTILSDSGARALVTNAELAGRHAAFRGAVIRMDAERNVIDAESSARPLVHTDPHQLCYVIYTSGSTGRPKGVMIEHRSASHLVRAEARIFQVHPEDRTYQGFSLSFDASIEEIWLAFHAGATLVAATPEMARAGPDLSQLLTEHAVTVLSCVPTLLSMLAEDVPTLRLLILGGETCPGWLVERWARPGLRIVNTYGPTEATVIATYADVVPHTPVAIGRPVPGYRVYVLDEDLQPVRPGEIGEICIGGIGVARGYLGLVEQTAARFIADPWAPAGSAQSADKADARMFRTGDLGRFDAAGDLHFVGRRDGQVKIRGFRVELAEIETALLQGDGVLAAACTLREDVPAQPQLVGYVVPREGIRLEEERLRSRLRRRLPEYMVPALIESIEALPRLPSGKLDRKALPPPRQRELERRAPTARPRTPTERQVTAAVQALFPSHAVAVDQHFFHDLGGHSLLAARLVSELRKDTRFARVSVLHVYQHPTIAQLAAALDSMSRGQQSSRPTGTGHAEADSSAGRRHFAAGLLQSGGLYFLYGFRALHWITPYLVYFLLLAAGYPALESVAWGATSAVAVVPLLILAAVATKWLVLGRIRAGQYPLWGSYYLRFWLVRGFVSALPLSYLRGTPLLPFVYRLLGARIGKNVHLESDHLAAYDLISIGDGASIDEGAMLFGSTVEAGKLWIGAIAVGRGCLVGTRSVLREHTVLEDGARLEDQSLLPRGHRIPRGETWAGSPARRVANARAVPVMTPAPGSLRQAMTVALYATLVLLLPLFPLVAFAPGMLLLTRIDPVATPLLYLVAMPLVGGSFVLLLTIGIVFAKWLLVGRVRAGTYPVHGGFYVRKWIVDRLLAKSIEVVGSLHATLYLAPWYRALGARIGRFVELSTATSTTPDLLEIDDGGTVADEVSLGAPRVEGGVMTLAPTRLGRRSFVGNGAVLPQGTALGDGSLVGVVSIGPEASEAGRPDTTWLGSPPIRLPRRQSSAPFPILRTFSAPRRLRLARGAFELLRITLPSAGFICVSTTVITTTLALWDHVGLVPALLLAPLAYAAGCGALALAVALMKWVVIGRFRPFERPLWSRFVWRLELVNGLFEFMVVPLALEALHGTPFLPWYFRLLGGRIGHRTYFSSCALLEFDLVEVGDRTVVNEEAVLQTHLFEDRVLKASRLRVGADCTLGAGSIVLYGATLEDGVRLDALSLVMKGESLPAGTAWAGVPARWRGEVGAASVARAGSGALASLRAGKERSADEYASQARSSAA